MYKQLYSIVNEANTKDMNELQRQMFVFTLTQAILTHTYKWFLTSTNHSPAELIREQINAGAAWYELCFIVG